MGTLFSSCWKQSRYQKVTEDVVVELNEEETRGVYWFKELPKVTRRPKIVPDENFQFLKTIHRFSALVESRVGEATNITPEPNEWRIIYQDNSSGFKMCESSLSLAFSFGPVFKTSNKGKLRGKFNDDVPRVGTMQVDHLYAEEVARAFWDPDIELKQDWDPTVQSFECVEKLADLAYVCHIVFKKFWPATQRDCVMCSEMVPLLNDGWAVCNQSVLHDKCIPTEDIIRLKCDVTLVVNQEFVDADKGTERSNVRSHLIYSAKIDLGGWVPSSLIHSVACKEWPKALIGVCQTARGLVEKQGADKDFFVDAVETTTG